MNQGRWRRSAVRSRGPGREGGGACTQPRGRFASLIGVALLTGPGAWAAERKEFRDWPAGTSPAEVGRRVAENFVARPFERPDRFVIYPRSAPGTAR